jgi:hypothetical protein
MTAFSRRQLIDRDDGPLEDLKAPRAANLSPVAGRASGGRFP